MVRNARIGLRMDLPDQALTSIALAQEQLRQFPNAALAAQLSDIVETARHSRSRPEGKVYQRPPQ
jgi:hypothetical protein